jgi:hypothetical protein
MDKIETRYWKRETDNGVIYFATDTNAAHARAESDKHAMEVGFREYSDNVPKEVHNGADRATNGAATIPPDIEAKQAAWQDLQNWTKVHGDHVAIQDQIAMLELWKFQLCAWANNTMAQHAGAPVKPEQNNVN